jgi:hypothetical protein
LDSTVLGQGPVAGCCECGDEPSGSCAKELEPVSHRIIQGKHCVLSLSLSLSLSLCAVVLPSSPSSRLLLTANVAGSYFASTIRVLLGGGEARVQ